jgi:rare lipoprotein A
VIFATQAIGGKTMINYHVQKGDTIAAVSKRLNTNWETLRKNNPESIGKAKNGNWFLKEGATVNAPQSFEQSLQKAQQQSIAATTKKVQLPDTIDNPKTTTHTLQAGETIWELAVKKYHVHVDDIMKDNNISDPRTLQVGQELTIRLPEKGTETAVVASWYGKDFHGKPMANGDTYDMYAATIAHKEMPLGTKVELTNSVTGEMVQAIVTDRGPYITGRDVDLSYGLAKRLSLLEQGVGNLTMRVL